MLFSALKRQGVEPAALWLRALVDAPPPQAEPAEARMIETFDATLPHGITLSCRAAGAWAAADAVSARLSGRRLRLGRADAALRPARARRLSLRGAQPARL
jgi:hypothetical protein